MNMLTLSIRQPWAWLIVNGWKNIENREWSTRVRGPILIHASKGMTRNEHDACVLFVCGFAPSLLGKMPRYKDYERGGIVGEATILDCVTRHESKWFTGPFGFVLADAKPLPFRPYSGRLGFFPWHLFLTRAHHDPATRSTAGGAGRWETRQAETKRR